MDIKIVVWTEGVCDWAIHNAYTSVGDSIPDLKIGGGILEI